MKSFRRVLAVFAVLLIIASVLPMTAFATESTNDPTSSTTTTTTTKPEEKIKLSNLYVVGSNNKNYLADPSLTAGVNKYSFYLPDWMEEATLILKSSESLVISSEDAAFEGSNGSYTGKLKLSGSKNTFKVTLESNGNKRELTIIVYLSDIPCKLEKVSIIRSSEAVAATGSSTDKLDYSFPSGTTSGVSLRIVPRHEQTVSITNLTGIPADQITGNEAKTDLKLNDTYKRYDHTLTLVEGTNVFLVTVTAGNVKKQCTVTIIVGDANANAITTTTSTETTTSSTTAPTTISTFSPLPTTDSQISGGSDSSFPPVLWVTVGVVIAVVLGACIFMIVNMGGRNNSSTYNDYDDYDYEPAYPARRNLTDYMDDDYGYGYGKPQPPMNNGYNNRGGYNNSYGGGNSYNSNSYNNYSDGYRPDYRSYDDGYGSGTPRGGSGRLGGFENDDDYGSGNYYGGY